MQVIERLSSELKQPVQWIKNVVVLLDEGNTIPFIARYRKEQHGGMDDETLRRLSERLGYLRNLEARKLEVISAVEKQEKLTDALRRQIEGAETLAEVEDLYRPYKQKRRTRATIAKERGLEPLALAIWEQGRDLEPLTALAKAYLNPELGLESEEEVLQGASDILAEMMSDDADLRKLLRSAFEKGAQLRSEAAKEEDSVYRLYYDFEKPLRMMQGHQILALNRGEKEGFLKVKVEIAPELAQEIMEKCCLKERGGAVAAFLQGSMRDSYQRLLGPSLEREARSGLTEGANEGAIAMFALNLKPLLMQPPVKGRVTMGLDPGYRNGCKVAVLDGTGKVLDTAVVYPTFGEKQKQEAILRLSALAERHQVEHIAIGNGTASRETERMVCELLPVCKQKLSYMVVNEAGASVYSASKLGAEEFPDLDVNLRSAVSIARRLQDPLAELVKIEPKAIGVGQYQHDMPPAQLDAALVAVIEDCVNRVGVDLNTASPALLGYVSGLSAVSSRNIVAFREENGPFRARKQLLKVPKIGPKTFEQCAGFLRVPESDLPLDRTAVHPESYAAAEKLIHICGYSTNELASGGLAQLPQKLQAQDAQELERFCGVGLPTLLDIAAELAKPGRDPRDELPPPLFRTDLLSIEDLKPGMVLDGTVRNVIDFGAFVDIGVHQDGLVHISQMSKRYIKHPSEAVRVGDCVKVLVLEVDTAKKRIGLSMKQAEQDGGKNSPEAH